jgi:tryptophan synthase alpha chain
VKNRIDNCFAQLRTAKRKGFIPYICAGDPTLKRTVDLAFALEEAGADVLELGLPFSDPLADGIVNQLAAQRSLAAGTTVRGLFDCVREIRRQSQIPIVLYTYLNPVFQFGADKFHREAEDAGIDGLLILDLPLEEDSRELDRLDRSSSGARIAEQNVVHIRLIAPTTPPDRMKKIAKSAKGFLYYVSREGVTGARNVVAGEDRGAKEDIGFAGRGRIWNFKSRTSSRSGATRRRGRDRERDRRSYRQAWRQIGDG